MTLLDVSDLSISIGDRTVVDRVSFSIGPGERLGLIGESGSGKSLTCFAIAGLLPRGARVTGSIRFEGEELVGAGENRRRELRGSRIGMVFQEPQSALDPLSTVGRQLVGAVRARRRMPRGVAHRLAVELAAEVGLPDPERAVRRYPHELSGGQRQRVVIASALATRPGLLLADEPTTALDVTVQARILDLLDQRCTAIGNGLLLVTHDMAVAMRTCDRLVVMAGGRLVAEGSPRSLVDDPGHPAAAALVDAAYETGWQSASRSATPTESAVAS